MIPGTFKMPRRTPISLGVIHGLGHCEEAGAVAGRDAPVHGGGIARHARISSNAGAELVSVWRVARRHDGAQGIDMIEESPAAKEPHPSPIQPGLQLGQTALALRSELREVVRLRSVREVGREMRALVFAAAATCLNPSGAAAQGVGRAAIERVVPSTVQVVVPTTGDVVTTGSGAIIDPRGYVLTNFHVVGRRDGPYVGSLLQADGLFFIETVESSRHRLVRTHIARLVRGAVRRDLALLRIVATVSGDSLPARTRFRTVQIGGTSRVGPGTPVAAIGFPAGRRTVEATGGQVTGVETDGNGDLAWLRIDARLNPGSSGGLLIDRRGRLIGIPSVILTDSTEPIEFARAANQIPAEWLREMRSGGIDDVRVEETIRLLPGTSHTTSILGHSQPPSNGAEVAYFQVGPRSTRARVVTDPPVAVGLVDADGRVVRYDVGAVELDPGEEVGVAVVAQRTDDRPLRLTIALIEAAAPLTGDAVQATLAQGAPEVRRCYDQALSRASFTTDVDFQVDLSISQTGRVLRATATGPSSAAELRQCVERSFVAWTFPASGASTSWRVPYHFPAPAPRRARIAPEDEFVDPEEPVVAGSSEGRSRVEFVDPSEGEARDQPNYTDVSTALNRARAGVRSCAGAYTRSVFVRVTFEGRSGTVQEALVQYGTVIPPARRECVEAAVRGVRISPFRDQRFQILYPFVL